MGGALAGVPGISNDRGRTGPIGGTDGGRLGPRAAWQPDNGRVRSSALTPRVGRPTEVGQRRGAGHAESATGGSHGLMARLPAPRLVPC